MFINAFLNFYMKRNKRISYIYDIIAAQYTTDLY